jgi:hypothetical protein
MPDSLNLLLSRILTSPTRPINIDKVEISYLENEEEFIVVLETVCAPIATRDITIRDAFTRLWLV